MRKDMIYPYCLIVFFAIIWMWSAINPVHLGVWWLENILVFIFVPLMLLSWRYMRFSYLSYTLLTLFMSLHVIGSHYTYADVPLGYWLQEMFGSTRNMYDRLVHFSFGLLLSYPIREFFLRIAQTKGFWSYYLPFDVVLASSALFEIFEWITATSVDPTAGTLFLDPSGDPWDAQKDIACAGVGALIAMSLTSIFNTLKEKGYLRWIDIGFYHRPLIEGEAKIRRWMGRW